MDPDPTGAVEWLPADDGHRIPVRQWPVPAPRAAFQAVHGMAEHSARYADVAAALNAEGFAVVAHDHRGHGFAAAPDELGDVSSRQHWRGLGEDVAAVNAEVRRRHPGTPVVLLGHSMGSFLALQLVQRSPAAADGLVLAGSSWEAPWSATLAGFVAALESRRQGENGRSRLVHALSFGAFNRDVGGRRTEFDWISRDEEVVDRYVADPRCGFQLANGFWRDFLKGLAALFRPAAMRRIREGLPVYLCSGDRDPVGHRGRGPERLARALRGAGSRDVTLRLYAGARHDVLHETNRDEVIADLLAWVEPHLRGASAGLVRAG